MDLQYPRLSLFVMSFLFLQGCGRVQSVVTGSRGELTAAGSAVAEVELRAFPMDGTAASETIGFGVTDNRGRFALVTPGAQGPLWLAPGKYCFTLESVGNPYPIPAKYKSPKTSNLIYECINEKKLIELKIAEKFVK